MNRVPFVPAMWLVLLAAAGAFALTMGTRQTRGLFLSPLNTATGLGLASISLAFAFGQLWWGLAQPFAGTMADKVGAWSRAVRGRLAGGAGHFHHALHDQRFCRNNSELPRKGAPRIGRQLRAHCGHSTWVYVLTQSATSGRRQRSASETLDKVSSWAP